VGAEAETLRSDTSFSWALLNYQEDGDGTMMEVILWHLFVIKMENVSDGFKKSEIESGLAGGIDEGLNGLDGFEF
jgi:hypothetical protein